MGMDDHERIDICVRAIKTVSDYLAAVERGCRSCEADSAIDEMRGQLADIVTPRAVARWHEMIDDADPEVQAERKREFEHNNAAWALT